MTTQFHHIQTTNVSNTYFNTDKILTCMFFYVILKQCHHHVFIVNEMDLQGFHVVPDRQSVMVDTCKNITMRSFMTAKGHKEILEFSPC